MERLVARELMDDEHFGTQAQWRGALDGLTYVNRYLGGWGALRAEVRQMSRLPRVVLDVGAGAADLSARLLDYLDARKIRARCVALDQSSRVLTEARSRLAHRSNLAFVEGDACHLPFPDRSFDLGMMNLALHHFDEDDAVRALSELARVAKYVIVNDLRRSPIAWIFARVTFPLLTRNQMLRNDGPMSVRRAYTPDEIRILAKRAGWSAIGVKKRAFYRVTLAGGLAA